MRRVRAFLGAAATLAAVHGSADGGTCELSRVDRASTQSSTCMACHDGSVGPTIGSFQMEPGGMSHPVSMDYASVTANQADTYVAPTALPPGVLLVAGKVECTSCHDGSLTTVNHVVDPMQLCYACHRL